MECSILFQKLCHFEKRSWLFLVGLVAVTHFLCQSLMLPYGNALWFLLPGDGLPIHVKGSFLSRSSSVKSVMISNSIFVNDSDSVDTTLFVGMVKNNDKYYVGREIGHIDGSMGENRSMENNMTLGRKDLVNNPKHVEDVIENDDFPSEDFVDLDENSAVENIRGYNSFLEKANESTRSLSLEQIVEPSDGTSAENILEADTTMMPEIRGVVPSPSIVLTPIDSSINITSSVNLASNVSIAIGSAALNRSSGGSEKRVLSKDETHVQLQSDHAMLKNNSAVKNDTIGKKMRCDVPPKTIMSINEMNQLLVRHRRSSRAMRPRWSSIRDQEIIGAKLQIENAPIAMNDEELYAPLFRNVSRFKRSYELMERTLKVYIYKDGEKPIFHQPILKGLYASEGWFMKLMEGSKQFVVKNPQKAHLFYMPFSSRMLEYTLYVRNSHNRTNLRQYLKQYSEKIAAKYRFWNRTGGADHFLVACHDWAPYETRHHMEHCIKALCNADVTAGFKIGRDVSLPETYVRSARNPLRDLSGKPPSKRHILAFYAGNMHGYLRPILLKHWKDKDPNMKIFGPMPPGVASKMNYIQRHEKQQVLHLPQGLRGQQPPCRRSHFLRVCTRYHIR